MKYVNKNQSWTAQGKEVRPTGFKISTKRAGDNLSVSMPQILGSIPMACIFKRGGKTS